MVSSAALAGEHKMGRPGGRPIVLFGVTRRFRSAPAIPQDQEPSELEDRRGRGGYVGERGRVENLLRPCLLIRRDEPQSVELDQRATACVELHRERYELEENSEGEEKDSDV